MIVFNPFKYKRTNYKGGGLNPDFIPDNKKCFTNVPVRFLAPRKIDSRDLLLSVSDQQDTSHCAGYAVAGYIEYLKWRKYHYPQIIDGDEIYMKAKELEGNELEGTTLYWAFRAAKKMNMLKGEISYIDEQSMSIKQMPLHKKKEYAVKFALHKFGILTAGFNITNEWNTVQKNNSKIINLKNESIFIGAHAVIICGYDNNGIYIKNSWGNQWGHHGFAILEWEQFYRQYIYGIAIEI